MFAQAQAWYDQVLASQPDHFDALHMSGVLAHQTGQHRRALRLIGRALSINPRHASAHIHIGNILRTLGQRGNALECYRRAIELQPGQALAHDNLGLLLQELGQLDAAVDCYRQAIALRPDGDTAHRHLGEVLLQMNRPDEARACFEQVAALRRDDLSSLDARTTVLQQQGKWDDVRALCEAVLARHSDYGMAHFTLGCAWQHLGHPDAALACYERARFLKVERAALYSNLGIILRARQRTQDAVACYQKAIELDPGFAAAYSNLGLVQTDLRQFTAALASFDQAIALKSDDAGAHYNRGLVLHTLSQIEAARASYACAIRLAPDYAEAWGSHGIALQQLARFGEARACYDRAIELDPVCALFRWNRALLNLLLGNFADGWRDFEWRDREPSIHRLANLSQAGGPRWDGTQSLAGKTVLLLAEQGLGDTVQFCRFAMQVARLGAYVILEAQGALVGLLKGLDGIGQCVAKGEALPDHDYQCPLMSVPQALGTDLSSIPAQGRYLSAEADKLNLWSIRLGRKTRPRIGLFWSGNPAHINDLNRSLALREFLALKTPGIQFVSLQKEVRDTDHAILAAHPDILHFGDELRDFTDTAALCELMDGVISVDSSVAHLAGALGKPVWILLSYVPDWRWLLDRDDSPWYRSVRLYRQAKPGSWQEALSRVRADLSSLLSVPTT